MPSPHTGNPVHNGTKVNTLFTLSALGRYAFVMVPFLAAAAAAAAAALAASPTNGLSASAAAVAQARATIRIISAVTLRLGEGPLTGDAPPARDTVVHADGRVQPACLIEFQ